MAEDRVWSVPLRVDDVPEGSRHVDLRADEATCTRVAKAADLPGIARLEATFDVSRRGAAGFHVVGRVSATVAQICVVTLEPMTSELDEAVDVVFSPTVEPPEVKLDDEHPSRPLEGPEPLVNGIVDLGAVAVEFLLLGIDPYPRKPGAVFQAPLAGDAASHPFAALAVLKKDGEM